MFSLVVPGFSWSGCTGHCFPPFSLVGLFSFGGAALPVAGCPSLVGVVLLVVGCLLCGGGLLGGGGAGAGVGGRRGWVFVNWIVDASI